MTLREEVGGRQHIDNKGAWFYSHFGEIATIQQALKVRHVKRIFTGI